MTKTDDGEAVSEYDKRHDFGDVKMASGDPSDPQEALRTKPNDEKCHGPVQHDKTSLDRNCLTNSRSDIR